LLAALIMVAVVASLNLTAATVALPDIGRAFDAVDAPGAASRVRRKLGQQGLR
jgi:hypothetical protein